MLISQVKNNDGSITVAVREEGQAARAVNNAASVYALAMEAANSGKSLKAVVETYGFGADVDLQDAYAKGNFLPPITHPDDAHLHLTGTGLTHLGSASTRDAMHAAVSKVEEGATDTMKMFKMGLEGGKPKPGEKGVQPEWFYKGNGSQTVAPGGDLVLALLCAGWRRRAGNGRHLRDLTTRALPSASALPSPTNSPIM